MGVVSGVATCATGLRPATGDKWEKQSIMAGKAHHLAHAHRTTNHTSRVLRHTFSSLMLTGLAALSLGQSCEFPLNLTQLGDDQVLGFTPPEPADDADDGVDEVDAVNQAPIVMVNNDVITEAGEIVELTGEGSYDPDAEAIAYNWVQTGGVLVAFEYVQPYIIRFTAPAVEEDTQLIFQLTVTDGHLEDSATVIVDVTSAEEIDAAGLDDVVVDAGPDVEVVSGSPVTLDGGGSYADGEIEFSWVQVAGPTVQLINANQAVASFVAPEITEDEVALEFELTVTVDVEDTPGQAARSSFKDRIRVLLKKLKDQLDDDNNGNGGGTPTPTPNPCPDTDGDGTDDCSDGCPNDAAKTAAGACGCGNADTDSDNDGTADCVDNCPNDASKVAPGVCGCGTAETDTDGDGTADCNDQCPNDANKVTAGTCGCSTADTDTDGDGTVDCTDNCPSDASKTEPGDCGCGVSDSDTDGDGTPNCNDGCPNDANKTAAGGCGCGVVDVDSDGDGTLDCNDGCPNDATKTVAGPCGCGGQNADDDGDGTFNCEDGCPNDANKIAPGTCGCGVADTDTDGDGMPDCNDGCPNDANKIAPGTCGCGVADTDSDNDGTPNCNDNCPNDAGKVNPGVCGCGVSDSDTDGDGTPNCNDGCPNDANKIAPGTCSCGVADTDTDGDGTPDCNDGCPNDANKTAAGVCGCGTADVDSDNDGTLNCNDGCPNDANKTAPGQCGCGVSDSDADSDGVADCNDVCPGHNDAADSDGDGTPDGCEAAPVMAVNKSAVDFGEQSTLAGFQISNSGGGAINYNITDNAAWLTMTPINGTVNNEVDGVTLVASRSGLAEGEHTATVTVTPNVGNPHLIAVSLTIPVIDSGPGDGGGGEPGTAMTSAARTTGLAPLGVFFDALEASSGVVQPADGDHVNFHYAWDFGDPGSGVWTTTGRSRNTATGYIAAHVYEQPGTYTARLTVTNTAGQQFNYEQAITVTAFAGTTYYVSNSAGSDSNNGLSTSAPFKSFDKAMSVIGPNTRILFKRGDSWSTSKYYWLNKSGPGIIGAYANADGSDNRNLAKPRFNHGSSDSLIRVDKSASDWRIMDCEGIGPGGSSKGYFVEGVKTNVQVTCLRLSSSKFKYAFGWSQAFNDHDQNFWVDCSLPQPDQKGAYLGGRRSAMLGTEIRDAGSHVLRIWHCQKFIISENLLLDPPSSGRASLKLHNVPGTSLPTQYVIVSGNHFRGDQWPVTLGPQNTSTNELVQKLVFERNLITVGSDGRGLVGVSVFGPDITVRNNIFDGTNSSTSDYIAVQVEQRGIGPMPHRARVYNNTMYRSDGRITAVSVDGAVNNVTVRNNLIGVPGDQVSGSDVFEGAASAEANLILSNTGLFTNASGGNFTLMAGAAAIDAGVWVGGANEDYNRLGRPKDGDGNGGAAIDVGACEKQ